ncbi:MAG: hypothetical protein IT456_01960 [Planctomycetes bacterium]|nr:hypothetical protein [Planctomycetota bacterium]
MIVRSPRVAVLACLLMMACSNGGGGAAPVVVGQLAVACNTQVLQPDATAPMPAIDLQRLRLSRVGAIYRVTTPANTPFAFDLVAWDAAANGFATVSIAHASDGGAVPTGGPESLAAAGLIPSGPGLFGDGPWMAASGVQTARLTLQGSIERSQAIAVQTPGGDAILVAVEIGPRSVINQVEPVLPDHPSITSRETIYSSDAWNFGMPTVAVSGDRTSVVAYEGDRTNAMSYERYEMRMQHDRATQSVTGGGSQETSADAGTWRDHEIAALYNVLAVVHSGDEVAELRLSFDRGATFAQTAELAHGIGQTRLVQVGMALDYSLAVVFWQETNVGLELVLIEGRPESFDQNGSPDWFRINPPQVVQTMPFGSSPLTSGIAWSEGGDLVIGYAASTWEGLGVGWQSTTRFECAVRPYGQALRTVEVDRELVIGRDPSVAVLGQWPTMQVFYAYEVAEGVKVAASQDGGATFPTTELCGAPGAHLPTVFARQRSAAVQVDLLYLASASSGIELHHSRWLEWANSAREDFRITAAVMSLTPAQGPRSGWQGFTVPIDFGLRSKQVSWLGYDAVLDGEQIVAVFDEVTMDAAFWCLGMPQGGEIAGGWSSTTGLSVPIFRPATPPPLAPGMTQVLPAVDPLHAHQLQLVRID